MHEVTLLVRSALGMQYDYLVYHASSSSIRLGIVWVFLMGDFVAITGGVSNIAYVGGQ